MLNFKDIVNKISQMNATEYYIAKKHNVIEKHNKKWLMYDKV